MNVTIYSRKAVKRLLQSGFPNNTAVISFYDPDNVPVDYDGKSERLIQIPLDDFQTDIPEADKLANFIDKAKTDGLNMICQCEARQNRSAGCGRRYWNITTVLATLCLMMIGTDLMKWCTTKYWTHWKTITHRKLKLYIAKTIAETENSAIVFIYT